MDDKFDLQRFLQAQEPVFESVVRELSEGRKRGHWMWFIFPQIKGLGFSLTSIHFAINSIEEARAYLEHKILGDRLRTCTTIVNGLTGRSAHQIFGTPDDLKFRSSMTLFAQASPESDAFVRALRGYYDGQPDPLTLDILRREQRI